MLLFKYHRSCKTKTAWQADLNSRKEKIAMVNLSDLRRDMLMARTLARLEYEFSAQGGIDFGKTLRLLGDKEAGEDVKKIAEILVKLEKRYTDRNASS
jgi:hypothetical protein